MKKKLFILVLSVLSSHCCLAQSNGELDISDFGKSYKKNAFFIGPKIGGSLSSVSGQPAECDLFDGGSFGFTGGIAMKARFGRASENSYEGTGMFGVGLEVKYRQAKAKTIANDDLSLGYLEIPVLFQLYPVASSSSFNGLYFEAGPDFAMLMSKSPDALSLNLNQPYPGVESVKYNTGDLKGGDLRIVLGLGYTIPQTGLDINARYYIGTSELSDKVLPAKMSFIEVSLAWLFNVARF
jgi:opacity protein-like surface antigen